MCLEGGRVWQHDSHAPACLQVIVGRVKETGVFEVMSAATFKACRGKMWLLAVLLMYVTGAAPNSHMCSTPNTCAAASASSFAPAPARDARPASLQVGSHQQLPGSCALRKCSARAEPPPCLACAGVLAALLDNVTTMLLMGPLTITMMGQCNRDPRPMIISQVRGLRPSLMAGLALRVSSAAAGWLLERAGVRVAAGMQLAG